MSETATVPRHPGLILGVARFYYDPRGSMNGMLNSHPGEPRLLSYAVIAAAILLLGRLIPILQNPPSDVLALVMGQTVSMLFFVPLAYYGLAALGTLIARAFGGQGSWREGRAAFFWAALVSAPVIVICVMVPLVFLRGPLLMGVVMAQFGQVFFAWAIAQCFAAAFGFTRPWLVFAVISLPALVLVAFMLLR